MKEPYKIYKATNIVNGKKYIGFTNKLLHKRVIEHKSLSKNGSNFLLHKAIRKYGFDCFKWEIIFESLDKDFLLNEMENYFIIQNNSHYQTGFGYNMTFGGECGMRNRKHTEESKNKLKNARKNRIIEPMLGKKHSESAKEKMSVAKLGRKMSDEYKLMCSERNKKRYENPEERKKTSQAIKLNWEKRKRNIGVQN